MVEKTITKSEKAELEIEFGGELVREAEEAVEITGELDLCYSTALDNGREDLAHIISIMYYEE
jgi:hypothetical protein